MTTTSRLLGAALATLLSAAAFAGPSIATTQVPQGVVAEAATTTYTGAFVFNIAITIKPGLPTTGYPITCTVTTTGIDSVGNYYTESKTVTATRSGYTANCNNLTINYAWALGTIISPVTTNYYIAAAGTGTSLVSRTSSGRLPSITLPASGTTTTRDISVTM